MEGEASASAPERDCEARRISDAELEELLGVPRDTFEAEMRTTFDEFDGDHDGALTNEELMQLTSANHFPLSEPSVEACLKHVTSDAESISFAAFLTFMYEVCATELALQEKTELARTKTMKYRRNDALNDLVQSQSDVDRVMEKFGTGGEHAVLPFETLTGELLKNPELRMYDDAVRAAMDELVASDTGKRGLDQHELEEFLVDLCSERVAITIPSVLRNLLGEN